MIFDFLEKHDISYERVDHPAVYTCEEARRLVPSLPGAETKNLFLRDGKGRRHFLLSVSAEKNVDLKALSKALGVSGLSLASPERLKQHLGLEPGSVTLLGVINDQNKTVEVLLDEELSKAQAVLCHPLTNTSTLSIAREGIERFLMLTGHPHKYIPVPLRSSA